MGTLTGNVAGSINLTGSGGTDDYRELTHKPKINNVTLNGDLTSSDLGIPESAVEDVKVDGMSVVTSGVANITLPDVPVQDVKVDGSSVVNAAGVANITIPDAPVQDVKVDGSSVVNAAGVANITLPDVPVQDVQVDGTSVVDADGVANINIPAGVVLDVEVDGVSVVNDGIAEITMPTVPESLTDLSDIDINTPSNDDVLTYDSINDKWINAPVSGGGGSYPDYSQTEQEICKWIDGSSVYQITLKYEYASKNATFDIDITSDLPSDITVIDFRSSIAYVYSGLNLYNIGGSNLRFEQSNTSYFYKINFGGGTITNVVAICTLQYIKNS